MLVTTCARTHVQDKQLADSFKANTAQLEEKAAQVGVGRAGAGNDDRVQLHLRSQQIGGGEARVKGQGMEGAGLRVGAVAYHLLSRDCN
mgnify:CR=1 FL=1